jgi:hypothetical protein
VVSEVQDVEPFLPTQKRGLVTFEYRLVFSDVQFPSTQIIITLGDMMRARCVRDVTGIRFVVTCLSDK